jgi:uncharacterized protein (DUF2141 family)
MMNTYTLLLPILLLFNTKGDFTLIKELSARVSISGVRATTARVHIALYKRTGKRGNAKLSFETSITPNKDQGIMVEIPQLPIGEYALIATQDQIFHQQNNIFNPGEIIYPNSPPSRISAAEFEKNKITITADLRSFDVVLLN